MFTLKMFEPVYSSSFLFTSSLLDLFKKTLHEPFIQFIQFIQKQLQGKKSWEAQFCGFYGYHGNKKQLLMPGKTWNKGRTAMFTDAPIQMFLQL